MASKDQIKQHIALTTKIDFKGITPAQSESPRKIKIMEHVKKSLG
jgi:hemerythrin superfamily protein